jgi:hypothetical protein
LVLALAASFVQTLSESRNNSPRLAKVAFLSHRTTESFGPTEVRGGQGRDRG